MNLPTLSLSKQVKACDGGPDETQIRDLRFDRAIDYKEKLQIRLNDDIC